MLHKVDRNWCPSPHPDGNTLNFTGHLVYSLDLNQRVLIIIKNFQTNWWFLSNDTFSWMNFAYQRMKNLKKTISPKQAISNVINSEASLCEVRNLVGCLGGHNQTCHMSFSSDQETILSDASSQTPVTIAGSINPGIWIPYRPHVLTKPRPRRRNDVLRVGDDPSTNCGRSSWCRNC